MGFLRRCPQGHGRCPTKMAIKYSQDWCRNSGKSQLYNNFYYQPFKLDKHPRAPHQNLHILSTATVTRIVFSETGDPKIVTAVEHSTGKGTNPYLKRPSSQVVRLGSPHTLASIDSRISTYTAWDESQGFFIATIYTTKVTPTFVLNDSFPPAH